MTGSTCNHHRRPLAHLCRELLLGNVWQEAPGINVHRMAPWRLHNGHASITQQPCQQFNLAVVVAVGAAQQQQQRCVSD
jgi:hypothetical protein